MIASPFCRVVALAVALAAGSVRAADAPPARPAAKAEILQILQAQAAAWNRGDVLVPTDAPWLDEFLAEVLSFTGLNDDHDDQVDAAVAAYDLLEPHARDRVVLPPVVGTPEWQAADLAEMKARAVDGVRRGQMRERGSDVDAFGAPVDPTTW